MRSEHLAFCKTVNPLALVILVQLCGTCIHIVMERTETRSATRYRETRYEAVIRLEQALERHHAVDDEPHKLTLDNRACACFCYVCAWCRCVCVIHSDHRNS